MTKELLNKASELYSEIDRLDLLIKFIENYDKDNVSPKHNDFTYLVYLLGKNNVLSFMRRRKTMLEKEFELC